MKYSADSLVRGLMDYADAEIMGKLPTSGKWVVGTAIGLANNKVTDVIEALRTNTIAHMLGIMDEDGMVDVDALIDAMKSSADKYGKLVVEVPLIGRLSFSSDDINNLRNFIR